MPPAPRRERMRYLPSIGLSAYSRRKSVTGSPQCGQALKERSISRLQRTQWKGMDSVCHESNDRAVVALRLRGGDLAVSGGLADQHFLRHAQAVEELLPEGEGDDPVAAAVHHQHRH